MFIGVIGVGVVGGAVLKAFSESRNSFEVVGYDIKGEHCSEDAWRRIVSLADIAFVCAPSPTVDGRQDISAVNDVMARLAESNFRGVVCLKSTVLPGTTDRLAKETGLRICHNPEFLTAAKPYEDFINQQAIIVGGCKGDTEVVKKAYEKLFSPFDIPCYCYDSPMITEIAKYMRNNYLAVKVAFANEFYALCEMVGCDYDTVKQAMLSQGGVEQGHWKVPGPDGKKGYSGMCLPKDARAMLFFMEYNGLPHNIIKAAEKLNSALRPHDGFCKEV